MVMSVSKPLLSDQAHPSRLLLRPLRPPIAGGGSPPHPQGGGALVADILNHGTSYNNPVCIEGGGPGSPGQRGTRGLRWLRAVLGERGRDQRPPRILTRGIPPPLHGPGPRRGGGAGAGRSGGAATGGRRRSSRATALRRRRAGGGESGKRVLAVECVAMIRENCSGAIAQQNSFGWQRTPARIRSMNPRGPVRARARAPVRNRFFLRAGRSKRQGSAAQRTKRHGTHHCPAGVRGPQTRSRVARHARRSAAAGTHGCVAIERKRR